MSPDLRRKRAPVALLASLATSLPCYTQHAGNRLTYLDGRDPYYVSLHHPKLITPQWVGEAGVEAVVTLAIDDMNKPSPWVPFLQPTMRRLKEIYGRAPLSIMTTRIDPARKDWPRLLAGGVSLECHTYDHPCPILRLGDFAAAKATYDRCVDLLHQVPGCEPVAFRVPCCDSRNTPSPRFYAEIFNRTTAAGRFLALDSSVFNLLTPDDPDLPLDLVVDADGRERCRKYVPFPSFVNTIENYPYPYVIGRLCWQFPCVTPSDWAAQNLNGPRHPRSFEDLKASLDAVVIKQGTFNLVFHPYGWCHHDQIVELVNHAVARHGKKVRFLSFRECADRLRRHLLAGQPLRAADGGDNGVRLLDLNNDGFLDVVIGNDRLRRTRVWSPRERRWIDGDFPVQLVHVDRAGVRRETGVRFGVLRSGGMASLLVRNESTAGAWHFEDHGWRRCDELLAGLAIDGRPVRTSEAGRDLGVRLRDLDLDGRCELIVGNPSQRAVFAWNAGDGTWTRLPFDLPARTRIVDAEGRDAGLRFVDIDEDGHDDVVFSNERRCSLHLYRSRGEGWSTEVLSGPRRGADALPMIARHGTDNGAWFHSRHMWVQNEDTARLPDHVDRRSFNDLLASVEPTARSPAASLGSMQVQPGFRAQLVAAEPLVRDPIAIAWGADGRLWVVEMGDYPLGAGGRGRPGGRVRHLEDTDDDGDYDRSTVFLDGLRFPTGVMPWRDGVLITCAPDILYAEDRDGDGRADRREVLFTGFGQGNQQHRVNGLRWGLDGWVYCANGDSGGTVRSTKTGRAVDIRGRDFRIRPEQGLIDLQTGMTQFGRCRDDWGNWFGGNSGRPLWHCVLADHYLRRNPHLAPPAPRVDLMTPPSFAPVFPISRTEPRFNDPHTANRFTSASGACIYRDELFGRHFTGAYFVCEPVHNLVHCGRMTRKGVTFSGARLPGGSRSEFLASSDNWFRPVQARTGPDGALWVVDMYRKVIEHPQWIPADWQARLDLRAGHDKGRIYRVFPVRDPPRKIARLAGRDTAGLVAALESPNGPQRDLAQRLLMERGDSVAVAALARVAERSPRSACRLQALCTLAGLGAAPPAVLRRALRDPHPAVRRHAVRIAEPRLATTPAIQAAVLALVDDPDPTVKLQLASSLGAWGDPRAGRALATIATTCAGNRFLVAAALSSAEKHLEVLVEAAAEHEKSHPAHVALMQSLLVTAVRFEHDRATLAGLRALAGRRGGSHAAWQFEVLAGLLDALGRRGRSLAEWQAKVTANLRPAVGALAPLIAAARELAVAKDAPLAARLRSIRLLGRGLDGHEGDVRTLVGLLGQQSPSQAQLAAAAALARLDRPDVPALLLAGWQGHGPALRAKILDVLLGRAAWTERLLDHIAAARVDRANLTARQRQRLRAHRSLEIRRRAAALLAPAGPSDGDAVTRLGGVLAMAGDRRRGEGIFRQHCAICHRLGGLGYNVGPDLSALTDRSPQALLTAILAPNRAVEARYVTYAAVTRDDRELDGILAEETATSITLISARGERQVVLRDELKDVWSTNASLMPEGYERLIEPQGLADLLAFVGQKHAPRKRFAGNVPRLIRPAADASLVLAASAAELYGPDIHYYAKPGVLGDWHTAEDRAVWSLEIPRRGAYEVYLDWACAAHTAGNTFLLEVHSGRLTGKVDPTGQGWGRYRRKKIGRLQLEAGLQSLVLQSAGEIRGQALLDLRSIKLVPVRE